jgi:hypothetical protein
MPIDSSARGVHGRHGEVAALVERLRPLVALEEEVLELRADVERVEAHLPHAVEREPEDVPRIALVGLAVRPDDVADHAGDLVAAVGHELERGRVGDGDHVRLLDRVEAGDRGSVEPHAVVHRPLELRLRDREALQVAFDIREPEVDELDVLLLRLLEDLRPHLGIAGRSVLRLDLHHVNLL